MKVYSCPDEIPAPKIDFENIDLKKLQREEDEHREKVKAWLISNRYTGKHTGETVQFPVADGYAQYMIADGRKSCLIHLPYGDAWHYRDVEFLPKKEALKRAEQNRKLREMFSGKS